MNECQNKYRVDCMGNTCFRVYQQKRFFFTYWSYMCSEVTFTAAKTLVDNLRMINKGVNNEHFKS